MAKATRTEAEAAAEPDTKSEKLRRGQVQDEVLQAIRHGLMVGSFVPGQVLSLRKLAARLGTSPMPVRDAVSQLIAANVLEPLANRSVRVPRLGQARIRELTEVRCAIEGMATRWACLKKTPQLLDNLHATNEALLRAIKQRDIVACLHANQRFHFELYRAADSEVLMPLIEALWLQCGPTMYLSLLSPDVPWDASAHVDVLDALRLGDPAKAQRAVLRDIRSTAKYLFRGNSFYRLDGPIDRHSEAQGEAQGQARGQARGRAPGQRAVT